MKHFNHAFLSLLLGGIFAMLMSGCEKELPVYSDPNNRLIFDYSNPADTLKRYSFVYEKATTTTDTLWYKVHTMGFVTPYDRPFQLEQVTYGVSDNAVPGKHYVAFDDPELLKKYYYIPANSAGTTIPIVLKRDASLKSQGFMLVFTIKTTDEFSAGYTNKSFMSIYIADFLAKPSGWKTLSTYYFGEYGVAKHQFLIDTTGDKWDDDFLANELSIEDAAVCDKYYIAYLESVLREALDKLNAEREAQGLGKLKEADGTEVSIPLISL
ncbi:DUF4843 domain-containing protein [Bacteroides sp. 1001136B_160425_E2]|uniref:DUF4843 domain-containing protein n=1 Tax=Bacteroides sp. 1001136B_160425_E2 TaxID=2787083 RepID=UPI0018A0E50B|nr:DUF4843 domain-containing protein [Bacteroides sp. 1001136B_160425_E2]